MERLLDFVEELSFVRVAGGPEEKKAAKLIEREIALAGEAAGKPDVRGERMTFSFPFARVSRCSVKAGGKEIYCVPYLGSGNIDRECKLLFLEDGSEIDFSEAGDLSDTAVLLNKLADEKTYKRLTEHHAAAFLVMKGKYYASEKEASLYPLRLRDHFSRNGVIPGFMITSADAAALVRDEVKSVTLTLEQENYDAESQNVLAVIEGTVHKEESIVLTAHYDSVPLGTGSWDNATGTTALLAIYRYFLAHPPKRTLRFLWCGGEEQGLLGSKAYIEQNETLLEQIGFCFNFDMCGTILGSNQIFVTGEKELETFAEQYCKLAGYSAEIKALVHSSDSAPFCDHGIPALGLSRETGSAEIHTIHDLMDTLSETAIQRNVEFAIRMIGDVANAAVLPVKKGMSEERKKDLDKYFHRDTEEEETQKHSKNRE